MKAFNRYEHNCAVESSQRSGYGRINGQGLEPVSSMRFGAVSAGFASCEAIAVYNVLHDLGIPRRFSDVIYDTERLGGLLLFGIFGTRIGAIGRILEYYGVRYERMKPKEFLRRYESGDFQDGSRFIITIRNISWLPVCSLHTFETVLKGRLITVYNRFSDMAGPGIYSSISDMLRNGSSSGALYSVYYILG